MTFRIRILPRAEQDAQHIFDWLRARSPEGAIRWWFAFDEAVHNLVESPHGCGLSPESESVPYEPEFGTSIEDFILFSRVLSALFASLR